VKFPFEHKVTFACFTGPFSDDTVPDIALILFSSTALHSGNNPINMSTVYFVSMVGYVTNYNKELRNKNVLAFFSKCFGWKF
jgi:hypothetical protein